MPEDTGRPTYRLGVKEMPADDRPRERLLLRGAGALSDSDLIALLLNTGITGLNVIDLSMLLIKEH